MTSATTSSTSSEGTVPPEPIAVPSSPMLLPDPREASSVPSEPSGLLPSTPEQYAAYRAVVDKIHAEEAENLTRRLMEKYVRRGRVRSNAGDPIGTEAARSRQSHARLEAGPIGVPEAEAQDRDVEHADPGGREAVLDHADDRERSPSPEAQVRPWQRHRVREHTLPDDTQSTSSRYSSNNPSGSSDPFPSPILTNASGDQIDPHINPYGYLPAPHPTPQSGRTGRLPPLTLRATQYPLPLLWPVSLPQLPPRPIPEDGTQKWTAETTRQDLGEEFEAMARGLTEREGLELIRGENKWENVGWTAGRAPKWMDRAVYDSLGTVRAIQSPGSTKLDSVDLTLDPTLPASFLSRMFAYIDRILLELVAARPMLTGRGLVEQEPWGWGEIVRAAEQGGDRDSRIASRAFKRLQSFYDRTGGEGKPAAPPVDLTKSLDYARTTAFKRKTDYMGLEQELCTEYAPKKRKKKAKAKTKKTGLVPTATEEVVAQSERVVTQAEEGEDFAHRADIPATAG